MNKKLKDVEGQCVCGAVTFSISGEVSSFHLCYCSRCRQSSGSAHASNIFTKPENITWNSGKDFVQRFELATAKHWATQFCKACGSSLLYLNRTGNFLVVPAGSLTSAFDLAPDDKIFCDSKAKWTESISGLPKFPGYPDKF